MGLPNELSALEAARRIESGDLTSEDLVRACVDRIVERNASVGAFVAVDEAKALAAARQADRASGGALRGIPFAVKDIIDTADLVTAYGSPIYAGHRPVADAGCVAQARQSGAVLLGKVATSEFATQSPAPTRNPLDLTRTPGGSSSGSAAAVADNMVPVAFGTQTTGSITRPAAYCGVVGYKPTFGLINCAGVKPLSHSQDTVGLLTRTVDDAIFFQFGPAAVREQRVSPRQLRIALVRSAQWAHAKPATVEALYDFVRHAVRAGAHVEERALPAALEALVDLQSRVFAYEARQSLLHEWRTARSEMTPRILARLAGGEGVSSKDYLEMRMQVAAARSLVEDLFLGADVLLYPAADGEAEIGILDSGSPRFGALWTLLHLPTVALRVGTGPSGLPIGAQLIGHYAGDLALLAAARDLARLADFGQ